MGQKNADAVKNFTSIMLIRLDASEGKLGWSETRQAVLVGRLLEEVAEVVSMLDDWLLSTTERDRTDCVTQISARCGDVANLALMISDNAVQGRQL